MSEDQIKSLRAEETKIKAILAAEITDSKRLYLEGELIKVQKQIKRLSK